MQILSREELLGLLSALRGWQLKGKFIQKTYLFKKFSKALEFVTLLGNISEEVKYHPEITLTYVKVGLTLGSRSKKGFTKTEITFAEKADQVFKELKNKVDS